MPIELHPPRKTVAVSLNAKIIFGVVAILAIALSRAFAAEFDFTERQTPIEDHFMQRLEEMHRHRMQMVDNPETRLGYYGFEHNRYHKPFYIHMNTMDGHNCCSGEECRPTEELLDAPPEFKSEGFDKMVFIDGDWYPVKMKDVQVSFDSDQLEVAKKSPLYQEFLQQTHVCARRMYITDQMRADKRRYHGILVEQSKGVYCILQGGVRM